MILYIVFLVYGCSFLSMFFNYKILIIIQKDIECAFGSNKKSQLILLLFMDPTALFDTIHEFHLLFQLIFTFICSTFNKKFSVSVK